ncbi:hypothetical protein BDV06DRAFT_4013 [Aspergillus oleicola]
MLSKSNKPYQSSASDYVWAVLNTSASCPSLSFRKDLLYRVQAYPRHRQWSLKVLDTKAEYNIGHGTE